MQRRRDRERDEEEREEKRRSKRERKKERKDRINKIRYFRGKGRIRKRGIEFD